MPMFVVLAGFTDQGIRNVKETIGRAEAFKEMAKKTGITASLLVRGNEEDPREEGLRRPLCSECVGDREISMSTSCSAEASLLKSSLADHLEWVA